MVNFGGSEAYRHWGGLEGFDKDIFRENLEIEGVADGGHYFHVMTGRVVQFDRLFMVFSDFRAEVAQLFDRRVSPHQMQFIPHFAQFGMHERQHSVAT
jgi:hypothetical protein